MVDQPMNRVEYVRNLPDPGGNQIRKQLNTAFIWSLTAEEACLALELDLEQSESTRRALVVKICVDMKAEAREPHYLLIKDITHRLIGLPYNKRQTGAYILDTLSRAMPVDIQEQVTMFFLNSPYIAFRRRGYKHLIANWDSEYEPLLEILWERHHDYECARIIVENFPIAYIDLKRGKLQADVAGTWVERLLFMRLGEANPERMEEVFASDPITYAYICTKLNEHFSEERAFVIYKENKHDMRLGLLIWCYGKLGFWSVLERIKGDMD